MVKDDANKFIWRTRKRNRGIPSSEDTFLKFINVDYAPSVCVCMCALSVDVLPLTPSGANFIDG